MKILVFTCRIAYKMTEHINSKTLFTKKYEIQAQVLAAQFSLAGENEEPKIAEHVLTLREQQARMERQIATLNKELARVNGELPVLMNGKHKLLLQAITAQRWYAIKNVPEVLYDSETGYLLPSFHYGFEMLNTGLPENFSLGGIERVRWSTDCAPFASTREKISSSDSRLSSFFNTYPCKNKLKNEKVLLGRGTYETSSTVSIFNDNYSHVYLIGLGISCTDSPLTSLQLPICRIHNDARIYPRRDNFTADERAQIILDFFLAQGWQPIFDQPEYTEVYQTIQRHPALLNELSELESAIAEALEYEATLHQPLTGQFDFQLDLQAYPLALIDQSSVQYAQALQRWSNQLLNKIDEFARNHHELIQAATALHKSLDHKLKIDRFEHVGESLQLLTQRDSYLKNALRFNLDTVRSKLINAKNQAIALQNQLDESALHPDLLADLATIQQAPRPTFAFIAEYTAQIVLKEVQQLEWLEAHQAGLQKLVDLHLKGLENFNVFTSTDQGDFKRAAKHEEIEPEVAQGWFDDWVQQRLVIEQQILPLYELVFDQQCALDTINEVLEILETYRLAVDKFYKNECYAIHQDCALDTKGQFEEGYKRRLALFKLCNQFQAQLEELLFALPEVAVRVELLRWSEVITQQHLIGVRLSTDSQLELHQDSETWQKISQEFRGLQERSLETFIQDVKYFNLARQEREKEFNSLVFRMRKALNNA